ncbi:MAG TPA: hypothetical protein VK175_07440 [Leadbetterella sp.]|nr:hypothetical protein [Leadbetterella sp.]
MNTKNFFTVEAIICLIFGIALFFFPDFLGQEYLTNPDWTNEGSKIVAQGYGSMLLAVAIANWLARKSGPSIARHALVVLGTFANIFLIIIHTMAIFGGVETAFAWGTVVMALILAIWGLTLIPKEKDITV